jgi:hypothetical protein
MKRALVAALLILSACLLSVAGAQGAGPGSLRAQTSSAERLPDLDQEAPAGLLVTASGAGSTLGYQLGFMSAVRNIGDGPLTIDGHRPDATAPSMIADQVIEHDDGSEGIIHTVGVLQYVVATTHQHWHLLQFDRYELRRAGTVRALVRDRKSGFCLGDRYRVTQIVANAVSESVYRTNCGRTETGLLQLKEGISVGYGDDYRAFLEGQDLPLNGLQAGRYVLVHRVNSERRLRELSYANNAASVLLDLRWRQGVPSVRLLRTCPETARCDRGGGGKPWPQQSGS